MEPCEVALGTPGGCMVKFICNAALALNEAMVALLLHVFRILVITRVVARS
jgi:hypothetical protein